MENLQTIQKLYQFWTSFMLQKLCFQFFLSLLSYSESIHRLMLRSAACSTIWRVAKRSSSILAVYSQAAAEPKCWDIINTWWKIHISKPINTQIWWLITNMAKLLVVYKYGSTTTEETPRRPPSLSGSSSSAGRNPACVARHDALSVPCAWGARAPGRAVSSWMQSVPT